MPRRPRHKPPKTHVDKYAPQAARSQTARQALDAEWARKHPATPPSTDTSAEEEDEEASA